MFIFDDELLFYPEVDLNF